MFGNLLGSLDLAVWSWLLWRRGGFWRSSPELDLHPDPQPCRVAVVIPARDEAETIEQAVTSLLGQEFPGSLHVILVDDGSSDGTGDLARSLPHAAGRLRVVTGAALPPGWTGKLWAVSQGLAQPEAETADFVLLTDADILHHPRHLATLVRTAQTEDLDLLSEMVSLRVVTLAERALIPAFVFFFAMLYPFPWVNDPSRPEAAAAGGTILLRRRALDRIGGVSRIRSALIDDVALAREVKRGGHPIYLGQTDAAASLRSYPGFGDVRRMIERTAFVQLRYSPLLLCGTVAGLLLVYLVPVMLVLRGRGSARLLGAGSLAMMAVAFRPTLKLYRRSPLWGLALPAIALFYAAATVASAAQFYRGRGGRWKDRVYPAGN